MSAPLTWHQPRGGSSSSATDTVYLSGVRREVQVASMLVAVVAMFIVCHSIRFLLNTSEVGRSKKVLQRRPCTFDFYCRW